MSAALPLLERPDLLTVLPGEQYRFHFDAEKCIGCKCCVVACNEQNGNPAHIQWRRVGELEGGIFPDARRVHLSMGCNHCLEPSCLKGCPVEAYTKDSRTGIVLHSADACIGCQYCTWNCSYGVPQFNADRGVVGKCDMCHGRLKQDLAPACVNACPEGAIGIEVVNMAVWRRKHQLADAPGMPSAEDSLSTTRITMPAVAREFRRVDLDRVVPQHAHWSLVFMLIMTQMAVGALASMWLAQVFGTAMPSYSAILPVFITMIALGAVTLHLGRPVHMYRAWMGWRTSWLSREVISLSIFAGVSQAYAGALFLGRPESSLLGFLTLLAGAAGVWCSARIYMVPARPLWDMWHTPVEFFLTGAVLGPRLLMATLPVDNLVAAAVAGSVLQIMNTFIRFRRTELSEAHELRAAGILLGGPLSASWLSWWALCAVSLATLPFSPAVSLVAALCAELLGRYLFFAAVVPKQMASTFQVAA